MKKIFLLVVICALVLAHDGSEKSKTIIDEQVLDIEEGRKHVYPTISKPSIKDDEYTLDETIEDEKPMEKPTQDTTHEKNQETEKTTTEQMNREQNDGKDKEEENNSDEYGYKQGSVCVYCKYCKLCDLCENCPCKKPDQHEQCSSCKYCKYCTLCGTVCDTVCTPGSFLDMFSSAVYDALPSFDKKTQGDIHEDIDRAKDFIKEYL